MIWKRATKEGSELRKMMKKEGITRQPRNLELLIYSAALLAKKCFRNYTFKKKEESDNFKSNAEDFRIGIEYFQIPFFLRLHDAVATLSQTELLN